MCDHCKKQTLFFILYKVVSHSWEKDMCYLFFSFHLAEICEMSAWPNWQIYIDIPCVGEGQWKNKGEKRLLSLVSLQCYKFSFESICDWLFIFSGKWRLSPTWNVRPSQIPIHFYLPSQLLYISRVPPASLPHPQSSISTTPAHNPCFPSRHWK